MKKSHSVAPSVARATRHASKMIEIMLKEMERGLRHPHLLESPEWERWFGNKQSIAVHLQKLVQTLSALPDIEVTKRKRSATSQEEAMLSDQEMQQLNAWLAENAKT